MLIIYNYLSTFCLKPQVISYIIKFSFLQVIQISCPLQKWICAACVLHLWCSECRTCASYCHNSYMRNMHATCVCDMCCLHTCMLQVCRTSVSCMYAYYYSAVYTLLTHMQATSVPRMCSLHTLHCCIHAASHIMIFIYQ